MIADRFGRTRALMGSILIYSVFTAACGLAQTCWQLALFRILLGLGMGGEWASGAALVSETWPRASIAARRSASCRARGRSATAPRRSSPASCCRAGAGAAVFFVGVLPALFTLWIRRGVEEPAIWRELARRGAPARARPRRRSSRAGLLRLTVAVTLMNACTLFAWWGFNLWVPGYLSLPARRAASA